MITTRGSKAYYAMRAYNDNIAAAFNEYMQANKVPTITVLYEQFMKQNTDEKVAKTTFSNWFNGKATPNVYYCSLIAKFLKIDLYELLYGKAVNK